MARFKIIYQITNVNWAFATACSTDYLIGSGHSLVFVDDDDRIVGANLGVIWEVRREEEEDQRGLGIGGRGWLTTESQENGLSCQAISHLTISRLLN